MNEAVRVLPIELIGVNTNGKTWKFLSHFKGEFLLNLRRAGTVSEKHFHNGDSPQKDPEVLILIQGKLELYYQDCKTGEGQTIVIRSPSRVEIYPNTWHKIKARTEVTFLELCSVKEHDRDTVYEHS